MYYVLYYPTIPLIGFCPREMKVYIYKNSCTRTYRSIIHNTPNQGKLKCPSRGEELNKLFYIYIMEGLLSNKEK